MSDSYTMVARASKTIWLDFTCPQCKRRRLIKFRSANPSKFRDAYCSWCRRYETVELPSRTGKTVDEEAERG